MSAVILPYANKEMKEIFIIILIGGTIGRILGLIVAVPF